MAHKGPASGSHEVRERVRSYRDRMRAAGMRPVQIWVPDTRSPAFRAEAHLQSLAVARSPDTDRDQAFVDAVSDDLRNDLE